MKYKVGDKVIVIGREGIYTVSRISNSVPVEYYLESEKGTYIWKKEYDLSFAENLIESEEADKGYDEGYKDGADAAWKLTWEIINMSFSQRKEILGDYAFPDIIKKYTASEALEKIKAYVQRIEVGDEVYFADSNHKRVVTAIITENGKNPQAVQFSSSGRWAIDDVKDLHKTSKHYDIQSILDGLKE